MTPTDVHPEVDRAALGFFRRSTIRVRLTAAFLAIALVLAVQGALGVWQLQELADAAAAQPSAHTLQEALRSAQSVVSGFAAVVVVLAFAICYPLTVHIIKPVRVAAKIAQRVAGGDLTVKVRTGGSDEAAQLLRALADMTENLRSVLGSVVHGAHTVNRTSSQIVQGNLELSQRTEEQAGTLEETASSLEELTTTVAQNADHARSASQLALEASAVARRGGDAVDEVVRTMDEISDASRKITEIIGVIDGIAFQTNILALNAAVEAARAGEQGRGFAVVAAEVRSLAQRSAAAAREIKGLIGASVDKVNTGASLVDTAGHTMVEVVLSVEKVSALIAEIAQASQEQSVGIGQVNTAVAQMQRVVERNAAMVEHAARATETMNDQAAQLLEIASRFRLRGDGVLA
ncbi:MAG TPA: methyl-accepting chemotaxis protein [Ramlibacter sp.]|uniref:methyl-accepting chemotaxis protein n=1 Tax=Ramlibacter sp. TaxID=1917967 RepID=UPI002D80ACCB|nr:methyl-accepting chemotaxis protein [Ramlibacter sp.]HET8744183.1 methyl-accepting chemotaxis protein [Ramlibacter sp.]